MSLSARKPPPRWDAAVPIPPALRPLVHAYVLAYASVVGPRLLDLVAKFLKKSGREPDKEPFYVSLRRILRHGLEWRRFPAFCGVLVGGSTLLEKPVARFLPRQLSDVTQRRLSRCVASFVAAWLGLVQLQHRPSPKSPTTVAHAGHTLDLSLFALTRAADVVVGELWARRRARRVAAGKWTAIETLTSRLADPFVFSLTTGIVMWAFIYHPTRLPRAYNRWIGSAAMVDDRLLEALRLVRQGDIVYGKDTGHAALLEARCREYDLPQSWGNPALTVPYPCELTHMGCGSSCEAHAAARLLRAWRWAMATYLPLSLMLVLRRPHAMRPRTLLRGLLGAARSSAFLGALVALFYYGVCLGRTRIGPRLLAFLSSAASTPVARAQRLDGGLCVAAGCALCGWSILLEAPGRRKDMGLFVAPRALAVLLPRRYDLGKQWRETLVFAASTAVLFTCVRENPRRVRGVFGRMLAGVLGA